MQEIPWGLFAVTQKEPRDSRLGGGFAGYRRGNSERKIASNLPRAPAALRCWILALAIVFFQGGVCFRAASAFGLCSVATTTAATAAASRMSMSVERRLLVRVREGEDTMQLNLIEAGKGQSLLKLQPAKTGKLDQALMRMAKKIKMSEEQVRLVQAGQDGSNTPLDVSLENQEAWVAPASSLLLDGSVVPISVNIPSVLDLSIRPRCVVGCPVIPRARLEFADEKSTTFRWKAGDRVIGEGAYYVPREEDVGQVLYCECTPKRGGQGAEQEQGLVVETGHEGTFSDGEAAGGGKKKKTKGEGPVVKKGPKKWPFEGRHAEAARRGKPGEKVLRVCSYNILVDQFCDVKWPRENLYWYTDRSYLDVNYRLALLAKELQGYEASVLCLQEVDGKLFHNDLMPLLAQMGFEARYDAKSSAPGEAREATWGSAVAWRGSELTLEKAQLVQYGSREEWAKDRGVAEVCKDEAVAEIMELGGQIGQVLTLVNQKGKRVVIANTHLFGNPDAPHVRILQMQMLMAAVAAARDDAGGNQVACIVCGDTNSEPDSGTMALAMQGTIGSSHPEWAEGGTFKNLRSREEREEEFFCKLTDEEIKLSRNAFSHLSGGDMGAGIDLEAVRGVFESGGADAVEAVTLAGCGPSVGYGDWHSLVKGLKTTAEPGSFEATFTAIASAALASPPSRAASPPSSASIGVELKHALGLESACKGVEATFCGGGKSHAVDVILHAGFSGVEPFSFFTKDELMEKGGLPTAAFPSDHVSLLCDLVW